MSEQEEYYVILFSNDLTYMTEDGYPCSKISTAVKYYNLDNIKAEIESLDDEYKENATIYKVKQLTEYKVEKVSD